MASLLLVDLSYDLNLTVGYELDRGQKHVRGASYNVLVRWQLTRLTHLVGSCFGVYKDCPTAFWLCWYTYAKIA
jgi:hypothetical protein